MIRIRLVDLFVFRVNRIRIGFGQLFDLAAHRIESFADHQTDQIKIADYQIADVDEIEKPGILKHHPRYPKTKCGLIEVLPGRLERLDAHRGRCAERQKPNEKYNNVDSRIMHRMIHRYSSIAQMNLS